jgi:hypothetical protein
MTLNVFPEWHAADIARPVLVAIVFIQASSFLKESNRRNLMAIMIGGAGAAYLSGGGLGYWELAFTALVTLCAYRGLQSYRFIAIGWLLHTAWDLVHHSLGHPIIPFLPTSSLGCAITDAILAVWFLAGAPALVPRWPTAVRSKP